jgi:hypothetical protein
MLATKNEYECYRLIAYGETLSAAIDDMERQIVAVDA